MKTTLDEQSARGARPRAARGSALLLGIAAVLAMPACMRDSHGERGGRSGKALTTDHPADPLGSVVAESPEQAPGWTRELLDSEQAAFLASPRLRVGALGRPNTLHYERLELPAANPSDAVVAHLVEGAVALAGVTLPGTISVGRSSTTSSDDGNHNTIPSYRVWDLKVTHDDVPISGALCSLIVEAGRASPATLTCRMPEAPSTFDRFRTDVATADAAARTELGVTSALSTTYPIYMVDGQQALARFVSIVVDDDGHGRQVVLDGDGTPLGTADREYSFTFNGHHIDHTQGFGQGLTTFLDVGEDQEEYLDTADHENGKLNCTGGDASNLGYQKGFVICGNDLATALLAPRPNTGHDFTDVEHYTKGTIMGQASAVPFNGDPDFADYWNEESYLHHAELQAFYNADTIQRWFNLLAVKVTADAQDPYRLQIKVHSGTTSSGSVSNNASATLHSMQMGDFRKQGNAYAIEGQVDPTVFVHEYHHHVMESLAVEHGWSPKPLVVLQGCGMVGGSVLCPRDALHEGLSDAFALTYTTIYRDRTGVISDPWSTTNPCVNDTAYPDNPATSLIRNACNSVVHDYWKTNPDTFDPGDSLKYEIHRRGSAIFGALFKFQKRYRDANYGSIVPATPMIKAEEQLTEATDDERVYLDALLGVIRSVETYDTRRQIAQAAFAEKNIFPTGGGSLCDGGGNCDALDMLKKSLTMAGPINVAASANPPKLDVFAPRGTAYESTVTIELSSNDSFTNSPSGSVVSATVTVPSTAYNNSPAGFFRYTPSQSDWSTVTANGTNARVYYRVRACLVDGTTCVNTWVEGSEEKAPFVKIATSGTSCSFRPPDAQGGGGGVACAIVAAAMAAFRRRRVKGRVAVSR